MKVIPMDDTYFLIDIKSQFNVIKRLNRNYTESVGNLEYLK